jgi:hypothetical protein
LSQLAARRQTSIHRRFRARANTRAAVWGQTPVLVRGRPRPQRRANVAATEHFGGREGVANRCGATCWVKAPFKTTLLRPGTGADRGGCAVVAGCLAVGARVVSTRSAPPAIAPPEVPRPCQYPRRGLGQTARVRGRPRPQRCANVAATGHLGGREGEANRCGATWWWVEAPFKITLLCPGTGADRGGRVPTHGVLSINQPALSPDRRGPKAGQ